MAELSEIETPQLDEKPLSEVLAEIVDNAGARISIGELTRRIGGRAIGALIFVFGLACFLPFPPGATTIFGAPLLLLAPQLVIGASAPWLPERIKARTVDTADLRRGLDRAIPWLRRAEAVSRPRIAFLFGPVGERVIGVAVTALALVLIFPIPLGNLLPALAVSTLSFSLIQRDGAIALLGYAVTLASGSVLVLAAHIIVRSLQHVWAVLTPA